MNRILSKLWNELFKNAKEKKKLEMKLNGDKLIIKI